MLVRKTLSLSDCELKMEGDAGVFSGYASVFGGVDSYGDTIMKGAFADTLKNDAVPKMFYNHNIWDGLPIGKYQIVQEDEHGLFIKGELTPGMALSSDVRAAMKHQTIDGLSVGGYLLDGDYQVTKDGGRTINKWSKLVEISVVPFPADSAARIDLASIKSEIDTISTIRDFERFLRDAGGLSKGAAEVLAARAKIVFGRGDPEAEKIDAKAGAEIQAMLMRMRARIPL